MPPGYQHLLPYQHDTGGSVPLLPSNETLEIIVPRLNDWKASHVEGQRHVRNETGFEESSLNALLEEIAETRRKELKASLEAKWNESEAQREKEIQMKRQTILETYQRQRQALEQAAQARGATIRYETSPHRADTQGSSSSSDLATRKVPSSNTAPPPNQRPPLPIRRSRTPPQPPSHMCQ